MSDPAHARSTDASQETTPAQASQLNAAPPFIVAADQQKNRRLRLLASHPWLIYVLPFAVFALVGWFEPTPKQDGTSGWSLPYSMYPAVYAVKIGLTLAAMAFVWPGYRQFPWRLSPWAFVVGGLGVVLWVGLCKLELALAARLEINWLIESVERSEFNPLKQLADRPALAYGFLAVRFVGLVAVVAVIEEFFLRGFVIRFFVRPDWWNVPFGDVSRTALAVAVIVPVIMHPPAEALAAAAWFSLVTWLMVKTRNLWDCVAAHAVTNLLLGLYVLYTGEWRFL